MSVSVLTSAFANGGRVTRYGDFSVVQMHGCSFATTPMELMQQQNWARARQSSGNKVRDCSLFTDRFMTVVARNGSGLRTRGSRGVLQRMIASMKANALTLSEWSIPHDINDGVEIQRKPPRPPAA